MPFCLRLPGVSAREVLIASRKHEHGDTSLRRELEEISASRSHCAWGLHCSDSQNSMATSIVSSMTRVSLLLTACTSNRWLAPPPARSTLPLH